MVLFTTSVLISHHRSLPRVLARFFVAVRCIECSLATVAPSNRVFNSSPYPFSSCFACTCSSPHLPPINGYSSCLRYSPLCFACTCSSPHLPPVNGSSSCLRYSWPPIVIHLDSCFVVVSQFPATSLALHPPFCFRAVPRANLLLRSSLLLKFVTRFPAFHICDKTQGFRSVFLSLSHFNGKIDFGD